MKIKQAFSLAEILLTVAIIGVIAGVTIPALRDHAADRTTVNNLKKTYADLSQVVNLVKTENNVSKLCRANVLYDNDTIDEKFMNHFNVLKRCPNSSTECFAKSDIAYDLKSQPTYLLSNGVAIGFWWYMKNCNSSVPVYIDVNGPKPPNKGGSDIFIASIDPDGNVKLGSTLAAGEIADLDKTCKSGNQTQMASACAQLIQEDGWTIKY